jgi:RNA 3'-terminal phosphate cyclase
MRCEHALPAQVGLSDFEASFLRLIEKIVDGSEIFVNETGTTMQYRPGMIVGGRCDPLSAFPGGHAVTVLPLRQECGA